MHKIKKVHPINKRKTEQNSFHFCGLNLIYMSTNSITISHIPLSTRSEQISHALPSRNKSVKQGKRGLA